MQKSFLPLLAAVVVLAGCEKDNQSIEAREERDPSVSAGQTYMDEGDYEKAITEFKKALDNEPRMARPHLELATIYQNYQLNPIHAIYHYDRYLELRPDSEKTAFINEQKQKVFNKFAESLINSVPQVKQVMQERNQLIQQNTELKRQLATALNTQKATSAPAPGTKQTATQTIPKTAKPVAQATAPSPATSASGKHQIYHVVAGDTLSKIANKFYQDSGKWDVIFEANRDTMRTAGDLKVGQTIVIPAIGN
ncbi:hypothetical protein PDESU_01418 [Pontiella desulfatans]|uniref:LysM domain-containing protein n=2 Tax=Pontiella desulfatans TaxID=2750659 RepID=A0A6C2TZH5_PONDE|nr:hypothetical protein PDESU_01418 [Pontiella desulfatans]